ncbi:hypothetical protein SAMN05444411_104182 [Lutibacter oricola]|uniref:CarboxypepD_reg-like domain-containing protein n=1 Tax=Lutibacter oricola TaxID=762486 RepID=A0A1H3AP91_9FLAO|nr:carboxypeptidase-like regulatory domain-containing protein [Lutibacter oricola]SDX31221.1 hypothetical protein SAMN05444411_104182 [Lutibacter oricola]
MKTTTNLFVFIFITLKCFSQTIPEQIEGKIIGGNKTISDVHIVNLSSGFGAVSNEKGDFKIFAKLNDTLLFSSLQFERKKIGISKKQYTSKKIIIELIPTVTQLDEVFIQGLSGNLTVDIMRTPDEVEPKSNFFYHPSMLKKRSFSSYNKDFSSAPSSIALTDPTMAGGGGAGGGFGITDKRYEKAKKLKALLKKKKKFSHTLVRAFGEHFFTNDLKISKDSINLFLTYCEPRNLITLYDNNKKLTVIEILVEESKNFKKIE